MTTQFEPWQLALLIVACVLAAIVLSIVLLTIWAKGAYRRIKQRPPTHCDIDAFVGPDNPVAATKVVLAHKIQLGNRKAGTDPIPLECFESTHVPGLKVTRKVGTGDVDAANVKALEDVLKDSNKTPIVIATIRMGFGHHRLAYSAASWALQTGHPVLFHDLLNIQSKEADLIKSTDELYSRFSRYASEMGGLVEKWWGSMMLSGDANALRAAANVAAHLQPLLLAYPKSTPIITTHQLCALTASAAGFRRVINLVVDNHPQWFLTVPNTLNIVQGPVNYQAFLKMGVQPHELQWAGHWCPRDMVANIPADCQRRIERAQQKQPLRILIPVGGAGAQRKFIIAFVQALADHVRAGKVQLFLNAGDHVHMKTAFLKVLDECHLPFDTISNTAGVNAFQQKLLSGGSPNQNVSLFCFTEYFPAVATTDILCRVADVLACKPSELAFYCVPKLHIRRVGDHEADSAKRSSECGDGTEEAREIEDAMAYVDLFLEGPDFLVSMNQAIINNNKIGIYDGCKKAVELALQSGDTAVATGTDTKKDK